MVRQEFIRKKNKNFNSIETESTIEWNGKSEKS